MYFEQLYKLKTTAQDSTGFAPTLVLYIAMPTVHLFLESFAASKRKWKGAEKRLPNPWRNL